MKKSFKMLNLDCANCAAKMENRINRLPGVNSASVSFLTEKLTLDAEDACFDSVLAQCKDICRKIDRHIEIVTD